jgi:hypothetical protein
MFRVRKETGYRDLPFGNGDMLCAGAKPEHTRCIYLILDITLVFLRVYLDLDPLSV